MALKLGNFQSIYKALNPSIQFSDEAPDDYVLMCSADVFSRKIEIKVLQIFLIMLIYT